MSNKKYPIITLIGSGKFIDKFKEVAEELTLQGNIVLTPAIFDNHNFFTDPSKITEEEHKIYDEIHEQKMLMSDYVLVVNENGYVGDNTRDEISFCKNNHIPFKIM